MKNVIIIFSFLFSIQSYGQRTFDELKAASKNTNKLIFIQIDIPDRIPELTQIDPIDFSIISYLDGGCNERITEVFEFSKFFMNDEQVKSLISKYSLKHFPINLIMDSNGELIIKNNSMYGDAHNIEKIMSILTEPSYSKQLKDMEYKLSSFTIEELKNVMSVKRDSLLMTDLEMIDLFVEKASEKDYDYNTQELIFKFVGSVNSSSEHTILENISKFSKNYIDLGRLEFHKQELKEKYSLCLLNSLIYSFRINDEILFNEKITQARNSSFRGDEIEGIIQSIQFLYFKVLKRPEDLFKLVQPSIDKQLNEYNSLSKKSADPFGIDPIEALAENLNNAAYSYYEAGGRDISNLKIVLDWSKRSNLLILDNPNYLDTYAHLLYISGNKVEAIDKQKYALLLAKKLYKSQLDDPQVKEYIENFEKELNKMVGGSL